MTNTLLMEYDLPAPTRLIDLSPETPGLAWDPDKFPQRVSLYVPPMPLTEGGLCDWIANAMPGAAIEYHQGFLLVDRSETASELPTKERSRLHAIARRAWIACELGLVHLFSMKVAEAAYRYIAVRSATALPPPEIRNRLRSLRFVPAPRNSH